ncbi:TipJ family phage tail tip protein [Conchiformibius steedae]|uniref:Host specificity protein J n=1 Tax=Conchiformibius steedae TaxID=153493 RepID=A0A3P2A4S0_9NEIS|nr:phage tail protein [Conchiformibius steedae]RRD90441.1 host specificity protein J [Conchiformibius steedae]
MGGKKEQGARIPYEAPNSLSSAQVLRIIDAVAEGELAGFGHGDDAPLKSVFFNDTPVQNADNSFNLKGVEAFFVRGTPDQPYIPGFAATERTVAVGAAVKRNTPIVRAVSNTETDRLRVTVGVERNLAVQENGDTVAAVTELVVELVGNRGVAAMQTVRFSEKSSGAYYQDVDFNALPPVPFNIRVRRNTPDSDSDRVVNNTFFASYVEITDIKLSYPHTALAALKIDSDQFGNQIPQRNYLLRGKLLQVPSNYNPETRQYTGLWDGSFKMAWTNNPVWVFYDLLTNPRYSTLARRLTAADVDKWALYEIAKYCDVMVADGFGGEEPRFVCNAYITDARQAADVLSDLAAAFCALPVWDGQRLSLRADTAAEPVAQYSNANVVDGAFAYAGAALKAVHTAVHVRYADKHDGWRMKTEYVADDAAIARYGLNIKAVTAFGCDSRGQAMRFGEWLLQTELRQQDTVTFAVGREGLRHLPHDVIRIADNDYAGADIGGRVQAVAGNLITLDRAVSASAGQILHYSAADGSLKTTRIAAQTTPNTLRVESAAALTENAVWALAGEVKPRLYRALSVRENTEDGTYTITALRHDPDKYAAVDSSANFERSTLHGQPPEVGGGEVRGDSGALALTWSGGGADGDVLAYDIKIYRNGSLYRHIPDAASAEIRLENLLDGDYRADIRARNARGVWSETLQKAWRISYAIEGLRTTGKTLAVDLAWNLPETVVNTVQTELRYGKSNDFTASKPLATLPYPQNSYTLTGVAVTDTYYFWARLTDADGRSGEWTAAVVGRADTNPAPIVKQIQGAIEKSTLSQALINQLQADDTAAENRAKAAAAADAANKVAAEARARAEAARAEAQARAAALQQETQARNAEIRREADKQTAALRAESGKLTTAITSAAQNARSELAAQVAQLNAKDGELKQAQTALDGKAAELSRTAQQLGNRITAAETVNREQATAIQTVTAAHGRTAAALEVEKTARAQGDAAEARAREALAATVGQNTAALSAERQARIDGDAANTRELTAAKSRIAEAVSSIGRLEQTVSTQNSATASRLDSLTAKLGADTNLINPATTQAGHYISESNGSVLDWSGHVLTDFVPVTAGQTYTFTSAVAAHNLRYAWYNAQREFVAGRLAGGEITHQTLIAPADAAFVRLSGGVYSNTRAFALRLDPTAAAVEAERIARVEADNALIQRLNTANSRLQTAESALQTEQRTRAEADRAEAQARQTLAGKVDGNTVALAEVREAKADKTQVAALARQTLSAEWQRDIATAKTQAQQAAAQDAQAKADAARQAAERAAASDAQTKAAAAQAAAQAAASAEIRAAKEAAAADAQRKADAARTAAASAAETADRNVLQQAAREAQAKADAAKRAAETAASADATAKANAAKAQAIADAAAKDAVLKREAAADAQAKADAVRRIAEAAQRAADTVAADLVREQQTRAAGDEANAREITAAKARLGTAESNIGELRQTTARQGQALAEAQNSLTARIDGTAAELYARDNLLAADIWEAGNIDGTGADVDGYPHFWRIRSDAAIAVNGGKHYALALAGGEYSLQWSWYGADSRLIRADWVTDIRTDSRQAPAGAQTLRLSVRNRAARNYQIADAKVHLRHNHAADTAAVSAELTEYKRTQAATDAAQTDELRAAKSQIGQQTAQISRLESTKADQSSVSAQLQTTLQSAARDAQSKADAAQQAAERTATTKAAEAQAAAERTAQLKADAAKAAAIADAAAKVSTAQQAAAADAQRKADAARTAAASAAETADRNVLQQAAREAQAKADAAKRAAETAASADATAKANAAKAQAKADAAADASSKADAAKNAAIAEAQRLNTAANARINELQNTVANNREAAATQISSLTAKLGADTNLINPATTQAGHYINESNGNVLNWASHVLTDFVPVSAGQTYTFTSAVAAHNLRYAWYNAQREFVSGRFLEGEYTHQTLIAPADAAFVRISGGTNRNTGTFALRLDPTAAAVEAERTARVEADNAQTAEITAAKSQIGNNTAAIDGIRSTKADKTEVAALARTSLASEWTAAAQMAAQTAKTQAVQAAASDAQTKASAAQRAAEQAAERLATAKANAAQAAAVAAASGDAQRKVDAAKAAVIADAAAKDEAVKRAAAADAQQKADTAKQAAIAEAQRLNTVTNARVNTLEQTVSSQNSATASRFATVEASVQTAKNEAINAYKIQDTRDDNQAPSWYRTHYGKRTVEEFKKASAIGLTDSGGTFVHLQTSVKWYDATGGGVHQSAVGDNGKRFARYSVGDNWSAWSEAETVAGAQAKIDSERTARVAADEAQTRELAAAKSRLGAAESGISELRQTVTRENSATASRLDSLTAKLGADTNLINPATTQAGHYISESNGNVLNWASHVLTDFVPVSAGQTYTFTSAVPANNLRWAWYNAQREFVSGRLISGDSIHQTLVAPTGAAFVRLSGGTERNTHAFALRLDPTAAAVEAERTARVAADNALTQQLDTAKSQIGQQTAQISRLESTKADQSSVSAQLQTTLQAAARDAQSKADAAKTAAERTAQAKAAEAQAAAERAAQLKADAAKAAALASASSDAQRKADAARACHHLIFAYNLKS